MNDSVNVTAEPRLDMTDLQVYGINSTIVRLLSKLRQYTLLSQVQMNLFNKPQSVQPVMREIYQFEELKVVMTLREEFDMFGVYTKDVIVMRNVDKLREKFEQAVSYLTTNMTENKGVHNQAHIEILDTFADNLQQLSETVATKSIFDEHFTIGVK